MQRKNIIKYLSIAILLLALPSVQAAESENAWVSSGHTANDPLSATYWIEGCAVKLVDGFAEVSVAQGSATKTRTKVSGRPEYGDIDGDGEKDAILILSHDPGGSGTFYYAAAALGQGDRYKGTNAVFLGDRIILHDIKVEQGVVAILYADRRPEESMSTKASALHTAVLIWENNRFDPVIREGQGQVLFKGYVIYGHEVRSFEPCHQEEELWLLGKHNALANVRQAYEHTPAGEKPYQPVFMFLIGKWVGKPDNGFGSDYPAAFWVKRLVRAVPDGKCFQPDFAEVSVGGSNLKITFDIGRLDKNGLIGDAGAKRALAYEFCIPSGNPYREEVKEIDPTASFTAGVPGRIGCGPLEYLCTGSTHQVNFLQILDSLVKLPYVKRIDAIDFE